MAGERTKRARGVLGGCWYMAVVALGVTLALEWFNQGTPAKVYAFLVGHPWMFLFNVEIVFNTFLLAEMFRRRLGARLAIGMLWLALGFTNFMVQRTRVLPLTTRDVLLIPDGMKMITVYFSWIEIVGIFGGVALLIVAIVMLLVKTRRRARFNRLGSATLFCLVTAATLVVGKASVEFGSIDWERTSLVDAYHNFGFAYGFTYTFADFGIDRPSEYSEELVEEIAGDIAEEDQPLLVEPEKTPAAPEPTAAPQEEQVQPNVVFVQMESFFNVHDLLGASFSRDPIPVFGELMENWPSGQLKVPSVGGGTANTEFEVLSGMNLDYFAAGEFPYNTILQDTACETICFNLKPLGYTATAIHNYTGTFYARNTVYAQLGFDHFVSQEYMQNLTYNEQGWPRDSVLTGEVIKALETTPGKDFVFAVTVQSHGKYLSTPVEREDSIEVLSCEEPVNEGMLENFVNEIYEVDQFLGELIAALEAYDEPVVLVLYGDHLPALGIESDQLGCGDMYQTTYVVWNNYGESFEAPDLQAFQLSANVLAQIGVENGVLTRFHQNFGPDCEEENYLSFLRVLEYDMLYGEHVIYEGESPYHPTDLQMGSTPVTCAYYTYDEVTQTISVYGENFTVFSDILVDGQRKNAVFADSTRLIARAAGVTQDSEVCVGQFSREGDELGRTQPAQMAALEEP